MNQKIYFLLGPFLFLSVSLFAQSFEWGGRFGGFSETVVKKLHVDNAGNSYTTGYFTDLADMDISENEYNLTAVGFYDVFVQKTNSDGTLEWAVGIGNSLFEYGTGITTDDQGNVYITGYFDESTDFDPGIEEHILEAIGGGDIFILKLDSDGNFVWAKAVGGTGYEEPTDIGVDELGNVYVLGYLYDTVDFDPGEADFTASSQGAADNFLLVLDSAGDFVNVYTYGGEDQDLALDMHVKSSTEIFISGFFEGTADLDPRPFNDYMVDGGDGNAGYTMQIDGTGAIVNVAKTQGGNITVYAQTIDADNNMYIAGIFDGVTNFAPESGNSDYTFTSMVAYNSFILKVMADGTVAWARQLESDNSNFLFDLETSNDGNVYATGYFGGTLDLNPSPTEEFLLTKESISSTDAFLLALNAEGNFVSAFQFGGVDFIDTHQVGVDSDNNVYLSAHFDLTVDINPSPDEEVEVSSPDFRDSYLFKIVNEVLSAANYQANSLKIYPNPTTDKLTITDMGDMSGENYKIYNLLGQVVLEGNLSNQQSIVVDSLNDGAYTLVLSNAFSYKFIKN